MKKPLIGWNKSDKNTLFMLYQLEIQDSVSLKPLTWYKI